MSTHFDGVNGTKILTDVGALGAAGVINRAGMACGFLWKPNEVGAGGIFRSANAVDTCNPYSDGFLYYTIVSGSYTDSDFINGTPTPGKFYAATDGWRIDLFNTHLNGSDLEVYRHTYFYSTGVWTHVRCAANSGWTGTASFTGPLRLGSFSDSEGIDMFLAAVGVWAVGGDMLNADIETMTQGLYAWDALNPTVLWDLEDPFTKTIDPRGDGVAATSSVGISYSTDEAAGWTYSLAPPTGSRLYYRSNGVLVESSATGAVRIGSTSYPFGP